LSYINFKLGNISVLIKRVTDQYTQQITIGNKQEFENTFNETSREVVNQALTDVKIMDEKVFNEQDGSFAYWVVIEISKQSILDKANRIISKSEKLQLNYDKSEFEKIFNSEMEKANNQ
jgi:hypothetical protein